MVRGFIADSEARVTVERYDNLGKGSVKWLRCNAAPRLRVGWGSAISPSRFCLMQWGLKN